MLAFLNYIEQVPNPTHALNFFYSNLGSDWSVSDDTVQQLENFTCLLYGTVRDSSIDHIRTKELLKAAGAGNLEEGRGSGADLSCLPPCRDSLIPHIRRVNHCLATYKRAALRNGKSPKPFEEDQGWLLDEDQRLRSVMSLGAVLPPDFDVFKEYNVEDKNGGSKTSVNEEKEDC